MARKPPSFTELKQELLHLKRDLAKKQKKLQKQERLLKAKQHVRERIQNQADISDAESTLQSSSRILSSANQQNEDVNSRQICTRKKKTISFQLNTDSYPNHQVLGHNTQKDNVESEKCIISFSKITSSTSPDTSVARKRKSMQSSSILESGRKRNHSIELEESIVNHSTSSKLQDENISKDLPNAQIESTITCNQISNKNIHSDRNGITGNKISTAQSDVITSRKQVAAGIVQNVVEIAQMNRIQTVDAKKPTVEVTSDSEIVSSGSSSTCVTRNENQVVTNRVAGFLPNKSQLGKSSPEIDQIARKGKHILTGDRSRETDIGHTRLHTLRSASDKTTLTSRKTTLTSRPYGVISSNEISKKCQSSPDNAIENKAKRCRNSLSAHAQSFTEYASTETLHRTAIPKNKVIFTSQTTNGYPDFASKVTKAENTGSAKTQSCTSENSPSYSENIACALTVKSQIETDTYPQKYDSNEPRSDVDTDTQYDVISPTQRSSSSRACNRRGKSSTESVPVSSQKSEGHLLNLQDTCEIKTRGRKRNRKKVKLSKRHVCNGASPIEQKSCDEAEIILNGPMASQDSCVLKDPAKSGAIDAQHVASETKQEYSENGVLKGSAISDSSGNLYKKTRGRPRKCHVARKSNCLATVTTPDARCRSQSINKSSSSSGLHSVESHVLSKDSASQEIISDACLHSAERVKRQRRQQHSDISLLDFSFLEEDGHDMYSQIKTRRRSRGQSQRKLSQNVASFDDFSQTSFVLKDSHNEQSLSFELPILNAGLSQTEKIKSTSAKTQSDATKYERNSITLDYESQQKSDGPSESCSEKSKPDSKQTSGCSHNSNSDTNKNQRDMTSRIKRRPRAFAKFLALLKQPELKYTSYFTLPDEDYAHLKLKKIKSHQIMTSPLEDDSSAGDFLKSSIEDSVMSEKGSLLAIEGGSLPHKVEITSRHQFSPRKALRWESEQGSSDDRLQSTRDHSLIPHNNLYLPRETCNSLDTAAEHQLLSSARQKSEQSRITSCSLPVEHLTERVEENTILDDTVTAELEGNNQSESKTNSTNHPLCHNEICSNETDLTDSYLSLEASENVDSQGSEPRRRAVRGRRRGRGCRRRIKANKTRQLSCPQSHTTNFEIGNFEKTKMITNRKKEVTCSEPRGSNSVGHENERNTEPLEVHDLSLESLTPNAGITSSQSVLDSIELNHSQLSVDVCQQTNMTEPPRMKPSHGDLSAERGRGVVIKPETTGYDSFTLVSSFQISDADQLLDIDCSSVSTKSDVTETVVAACTTRSVHLWQGRDGSSYRMTHSWHISKKDEDLKKVYLLLVDTTLAILAESQISAILFFGSSEGKTVGTPVSHTDIKRAVTQVAVGVLSDLFFISRTDEEKTTLHKYRILGHETYEVSRELQSVQDSIVTICPVEGIDNALLGISSKTLYIWNHIVGCLLRSVDTIVNICFCPRVIGQQGLLFLPFIWCKDETCHFLMVNPQTGKSSIINSLQRPVNMDATDRLIGLTSQRDHVIGVSKSGLVALWCLYSGKCLGSYPNKGVQAVSFSRTLLLAVADRHSIDIYRYC